jgi:3-phenylpropionate/trans-cinnamate dioxygenase ferredoxin reductase subunit
MIAGDNRMINDILIVGGGQAACQIAGSLRSEGFAGTVRMIAAEPVLPYHRPPLSKAYLMGKATEDSLPIRPPAFYETNRIETLLAETVTEIDRRARRVTTGAGRRLSYDRLVLATGTRARPLPLAGSDLEGVVFLRTLADADDLKRRLAAAGTLVIIGGGFIGLEVAASARVLGKSVTVLEALPRLMGRAVAPMTSDFFLAFHRSLGNTVLTEARIERIGGDGRVSHVVLGDGRKLEADLVLIGVGALPNMELAQEAGLSCTNGIAVDEFALTSDPLIAAAGDCAEHPNRFAGGRFRLESVQNATDQGRIAAKSLLGQRVPYDSVPWFWSDQADVKLQIAGLPVGADEFVVRGDPGSRRFSVFQLKAGRLVCVDSVNRPGDHMAARRLIEAGISPRPAELGDECFDLKQLMPRRAAVG